MGCRSPSSVRATSRRAPRLRSGPPMRLHEPLPGRAGSCRLCAWTRARPPDVGYTSATTGLRSTPTLPISTSQTSPSTSQRCGSRPMPTPLGVPVAITSPGSSVIAAET